jgi:N,N'-diacetyllegionaminate synthase
VGQDLVGEAEQRYLREAASRAVAAHPIAEGAWILPEDVSYRRTPDETALFPDEAAARLPARALRPLGRHGSLTAETVRELRIAALLACRLKSTRLPGKAVLPLHGVTAIERCLLNALQIPQVDRVILATSTHPDDAPLTACTLDGRVKVFRGAEDDVIQRFLDAAEQEGADIVLRITGDCPVVSYEMAALMIESHVCARADFTDCEDHAQGTAGDIYTVAALRRLKALKPDTSHSEYMSFYFRNNPEHFVLNRAELPARFRHPEWRLTLDEPDDAKLFEELFAFHQLGREPLAFDQIAAFFQARPGAADINGRVALKWVDDREFVSFLHRVTRIDGDAGPTERGRP